MRNWTFLLAVTLLLCPFSFGASFNPNIANQIDTFLTGRGSPIAGNGSSFLSDGITYNVDPRLILAIAGAESSFGTKWVNCPASGFNAWSWFYKGNCPSSPFASFSAGIDTVTKFMRRSYLNKGRTSIALIGRRYCSSGCQNWTPNVTSYYSQLGGDVLDLGFMSLNGQWAGTVTGTDEGGTETVQVSASFSISGKGISATVTLTEPGDVPDTNTITYNALTPTTFSMTSTEQSGVLTTTTASGNVSVGSGQASISGNGMTDDPTTPSSGVGSFTLSRNLVMSGTVTVTEPDGVDTGTGTLTISSDGNTISGNLTLKSGGTASWTLTKQ